MLQTTASWRALCDELEDALGPGPGAIVVTGHDRRLRSRWQGAEVRVDPVPTGTPQVGPVVVDEGG